jgi:hypothetical protein
MCKRGVVVSAGLLHDIVSLGDLPERGEETDWSRWWLDARSPILIGQLGVNI